MERQANESRASTVKAMQFAKQSADAALLNAHAVINAERPWLLVSIEEVEGKEGEWVVRATNTGNTPAELVEGHCAFMPQPGDFRPPDNLFDPFFAPIQSLFVKDDGFEIRRITIQTSVMGRDEFFRVFANDPIKFLYVYGKILYWDTFTDRTDPRSEPHVTQWIFIYDNFRKKFGRAPGTYAKHS